MLENDGVLPLDPARGQRLAIIGPTRRRSDGAALRLQLPCASDPERRRRGSAAGRDAADGVRARLRCRSGRVQRRAASIIEERKYGSPVFPGDVENEHVARSALAGLHAGRISFPRRWQRAGGRCGRRVCRRSCGPVPDRHGRRGLGCRLARSARRAAAAARRRGRHRNARRRRAHERPPLQPRAARGQARGVRDGVRRRPGRRARAGRRADAARRSRRDA